MSTTSPRAEHLWLELKSVAEEILRLDLELDEELERLATCQDKQQQLREEITQLQIEANSHLLTETIKRLISECMRLEQDINNKFTMIKNDLSIKITNIQQGVKVKDAYSPHYTQAEGYFVDKQK